MRRSELLPEVWQLRFEKTCSLHMPYAALESPGGRIRLSAGMPSSL
jgi:hypothetical protein